MPHGSYVLLIVRLLNHNRVRASFSFLVGKHSGSRPLPPPPSPADDRILRKDETFYLSPVLSERVHGDGHSWESLKR